MSTREYERRRKRLLERLEYLGVPYPRRCFPHLYARVGKYRPAQLRAMRRAIAAMKE